MQLINFCVFRYFKQWSCVLSLRDLQENLARNHSEKRRKNLVFHSWSQLVVDEKVEIWRKEKEALAFRNSVILRKSFSKWKKLKVWPKNFLNSTFTNKLL